MADPTTGMDAVADHLRRQAANIARQHPRCATCEHWDAPNEWCDWYGNPVRPTFYCALHTEVQP